MSVFMRLVCVVFVAGVAGLWGADGLSFQELRKRGLTAYQQGNYKDAWTDLRAVVLHDESHTDQRQRDFPTAVDCLRRLRQFKDFDAFVDETLEAHPKDPWLAGVVAEQFFSVRNDGRLIDDVFVRGSRDRGPWANSQERDWVRVLSIYQRYLPQVVALDTMQAGGWLLQMAHAFRRGPQGNWALQQLTDLQQLPAVTDRWRGHPHGQGAATDADGNPVFYRAPATFAEATNNGARWRWLLDQAEQRGLAAAAQTERAEWAYGLYGVHTLGGRFSYLPQNENTDKVNPFDLTQLGDDETIANLASGIKRFSLPADYQFISLYQAQNNWRKLGALLQNRRQYARAAEAWLKAGDKHAHAQIVQPWVRFEGGTTGHVGAKTPLSVVYRNGTELRFTATKVDVNGIVADLKDRLQEATNRVPWNILQLQRLGDRLVRDGDSEWLLQPVAQWTVALDPNKDHSDSRLQTMVPVQKAGAYLITAETKDGNTARTLLWINDTILVKKPIDGSKEMVFVADAVTGKPVAGAQVDFFGYRWQRHRNGNSGTFITTELKAESNEHGIAILQAEEKDQRHHMNWLITARTDGGRSAFISNAWFNRSSWHSPTYNQNKTFFISDRPLYKPGDTMKFKLWSALATYAKETGTMQRQSRVNLVIWNPKNEEVFNKEFRTDDFGGASGSFDIPGDATLGNWRIMVSGAARYHANFRVEEYKKPEFEVSVDAPTKPVKLGDTITATISAKYYFGAPVSSGTVRYTVTRTQDHGRWFMPTQWDWLYGSGWWWGGVDYDWYPGWRHWGVPSPVPFWWHRPGPQPEVVSKNEVPLGADGTVEIAIDTELAKVLFGDKNQRYNISVEVTDASRRTIVGTGSVLASAAPFKVYTWVDRGFYQAGDSVNLQAQARTAGGDAVAGEADIRLFAIHYPEVGDPVETQVNRWQVAVSEAGRVEQRLVAAKAGQYRAQVTVTDLSGQTMTGAYIFTVVGGDEAATTRFNALELMTNKQQYAPGETADFLIASAEQNATVLFFKRPIQGVYQQPELISLVNGQSRAKLALTAADQPNIFVEALTIHNGKVHTVIREIHLPPVKRVLDVQVTSSKAQFKPGEAAQFTITLRDADGKPFVGSTVVTLYDRALEYISGGSNVRNIRDHFWKWKRQHRPNSQNSLISSVQHLHKNGERVMQILGVFGHIIQGGGFDDGAIRRQGGSGAFMAIGSGGGASGAFGNRMTRDAAAPMASMAVAESEMVADALVPEVADDSGNPSAQPVAVRKDFADTAYWTAALTTGKDGTATVTVPMPENLTGWACKVWAMAEGTRVGQGSTEVVTAKDLLVRLQTPRFAVQKDEFIVSGNIHNYLPNDQKVTVRLKLDGGVAQILNEQERVVTVPADGEQRIDWRVAITGEGEVVARIIAQSAEENDAMELRFPAKVHGQLVTDSVARSVRPDEQATTFSIDVPEERRVEQTQLTIRWSPTVAGAMIDALPYLMEYPYGCTEQTLNRFVPTVIARKTLQDLGVDLAAIETKRNNLNAGQLGDAEERAKEWQRFDRNPVFDANEADSMARQGLERLQNMQLSDGGWGWFSGYGERSYPHTTATVLRGLLIAQASGLAVPQPMIDRGVRWLEQWRSNRYRLLEEGDREPDARGGRYLLHAQNIDALVQFVLVTAGKDHPGYGDHCYNDRNHLGIYSKALLGIAYHELGKAERVAMLHRNVAQFLEQNEDNQTAWLNIGSPWWYWYGSEIEAQAAFLELSVRIDPQGELPARLAKYLVNNRRGGHYWRSTRDTAYAVQALATYITASGELKSHQTVRVFLDDELMLEESVTPETLFVSQNTLVVDHTLLPPGTRTIRVERDGEGPLYVNAWMQNFTMAAPIQARGLEVKVTRTVRKITRGLATEEQRGGHGQAVQVQTETVRKTVVQDGDNIASGDELEVELLIESANDYEYVLIEDLKAAGLEAVAQQSGYSFDGLMAYIEYRDDRVSAFVRQLPRGKHSIRYTLRAEIPGHFHALPATIEGMYAPELIGNSDEWRVRIEDRE